MRFDWTFKDLKFKKIRLATFQPSLESRRMRQHLERGGRWEVRSGRILLPPLPTSRCTCPPHCTASPWGKQEDRQSESSPEPARISRLRDIFERQLCRRQRRLVRAWHDHLEVADDGERKAEASQEGHGPGQNVWPVGQCGWRKSECRQLDGERCRRWWRSHATTYTR